MASSALDQVSHVMPPRTAAHFSQLLPAELWWPKKNGHGGIRPQGRRFFRRKNLYMWGAGKSPAIISTIICLQLSHIYPSCGP
ncbi:hypothetical protein AG1IA_02993 [Rhizoctonia solani AG-1 IA]|uniref:Uncharacterized protein n=1 Tax=Thanatephorus cucumeris (strain AG1-IA) TaxID=983506 RepID=L8WY17_THACA|nr:hypothetical protein AG1IA_02993 [Rhizoctonia solani AG-1 IA]